MAAPVVIATPANVWTKVATNVTSAIIRKCDTIKSKAPTVYLVTHRLTGAGAPTVANQNEGVKMFQVNPEVETLSSTAAMDVYVFVRPVDGELRIDL